MCQNGLAKVKAWCRMITGLNRKGQQAEAFTAFQRMQMEGTIPNQITLIAALNSCLHIQQVRAVHEYVSESRCEQDALLCTALLSSYGKMGDLPSAIKLFETLATRDLVAWTALITAYVHHGKSYEALKLYMRMSWEGVCPNRVTFLSLIGACTKIRSLRQCKAIHAHVLESEEYRDMVIQNALISMYDRCGSLENAKVVFNTMAARDVISWTSIISAFAKNGQEMNAMVLFRSMLLQGYKPNKVNFLAVLDACCSLGHGELISSCITESGFESDLVISTALVNMYGKFPATLEVKARVIFDKVESKDSVMWNAMVAAYAQHGLQEQALKLYNEMEAANIPMDKPVFVSILGCLTGPSSLEAGRGIHVKAIQRDFERDTIVRNALMNMFGKCGRPDDARKLFESGCVTSTNLISWNTMIAAYSHNGDFTLAVHIFRRMLLHGLLPDKATLVTVLYACTLRSGEALVVGKLVHSQGTQRGYSRDVVFQTALVVMYGKCGDLADSVAVFQSIDDQRKDTASWNAMVAAFGYHGKCDEARSTFDVTPYKNLASWNAILAAYAQHSRWSSECFGLFQQMLADGFIPDEITLVTVLSSLAATSALAEGRTVHRFAAENRLMRTITVENAVVDLYSKCGDLNEAVSVMERMAKVDVVTWNSLISGFAQHGHGRKTVDVFRGMVLNGYLPNHVTLVSVLRACGHVGLVDEGCQQFESVVNGDYGFEAVEELWGCMVDLLGRAGHLEEAEMVIWKMPFEPNVIALMSLLSSCKLHGDLELCEAASTQFSLSR